MKVVLNKLSAAIRSPLMKLLKMKRTLVVILACLIMACSLFLINVISFGKLEQASNADAGLASEQKLQSQINDLSHKLFALNSSVSQLQTSGPSSTGTVINQQVLDEFETSSANIKNLSNEIDSLQIDVKSLQNKLKVAETTIGSLPITVNGLSVLFITNDIETGLVGVNNTSVVQFAIKIVNTTNSAIANLDVTGTVTASVEFSDALALGYPQIIDGAGLFNYVFFITDAKDVHFEAFGNGKTSVSVPPGGSITLRPKVTLLPGAGKQLPDMTMNISLTSMTYDKVAAK
jgi:uncharacterized protein YlxW (UPF0749 family)